MDKKETVVLFARVKPEADAKVRRLAEETNRGIGDMVTEAILAYPENGVYANEKRVIMVKHADGRLEVEPAFGEPDGEKEIERLR
jgi:hypothetical protein